MTTQYDRRVDLSGGIQGATTWQLRKPSEVEDAINGRFNEVVGAIIRRLGYVTEGSALQSGKRGLGVYEAKWSTGAKLLAAIDDSGDTTTKIKMYDGSSSWSNLSLPSSLDPNTRVQFIDSQGETYVAGQSTSSGNRISLLNIVSGGTVSNTRSLLNAPKAKFIARYNNCLYAINCEVNGTVYSNRAYRSSPAMGIITFTRGDQDVFDSLDVDTVRYIKAGMAIDIYTAGTETKTHDITVTSVDKANDSIAYNASTASTFATTDVNTTTDIITIGRNLATGTPVKITSTSAVPAGLTSGIVYYAINQSSTTIKLAATRTNATAGTAIDITSTGSGTHTITSGVFIPDNDEIWLDGRKNELYYLWNTDYPTPPDADFIEIPPGTDSDVEITGWAKGNNRLFLFTKNSMMKWDGASPVIVYEDIGCVNHETIQNIGDWLIWLDSDGRIRARNDATGQDELISRPIESILSTVSASDYANASAGQIGNVYKLCFPAHNGKALRLCYDFDSNTWAHDIIGVGATGYVRSDKSGERRLYFLAEDGQLYLDDEGNTDAGVAIPMIVKLGRTNHTADQLKNYHGIGVYSSNAAGSIVKVSMDGSADFVNAGEIRDSYSKIALTNARQNFHGRDINVEISNSTSKARPQIEGLVYFFNFMEDKFGLPTA